MLNLAHFQELAQDREDSVRLLNKPSMKGIRASIVEKYSEKAHFVYELLQNADDVGATYVRFILRKSGLYFIHNGTTHFSITSPLDTQKIGHINAITAIGDSAKNEAETPKIGKFGIGFKAVFQYTNTPHIYDPNISFKIRDLIVPVLMEQEAHPLRKNDETLFFFPFDRPEKTAQEAVDEIEDKLKNLLFPLIFLRNLKHITWETDNNVKGAFKLYPLSIEDKNIETHAQTLGKKTHEQHFIRFSKDVSAGQNVQIVFLLDNENQILTQKKYPAFCFFPTKVMSGLRFLIHAPFMLSDSREGIRQKERWNEQLVQHLAELVANGLEILANDTTYDSENLFSVFPFEKQDLEALFTPITDAIIQKLHQKPLLPTNNGEMVLIQNAYLAENSDVLKAFPNEQLAQVMGENAQWIFTDLTHHNKFWHTVKTHLTADKNVVTADFLRSKLSFLKKEETHTLSVLEPISDENSVLKPEIIEIWDTLSDEERFKLMRETEPEATFATWEEVQDFDLVGLEAFLNSEMTFEKSLFLWRFLIDCFEKEVFNIHNYFGNYSFAWKSERVVSFDALYWRRLKTVNWLFDKNIQTLQCNASTVDNLHEKYKPHPLLIKHLFNKKEEPIDRFAHLTDDEKRAIEVGKRFLEQGFSTEDFLELRRIKATKAFQEKGFKSDKSDKNFKKSSKKSEKSIETEDNKLTSSDELLKKKQELRDELEAELEEKIEQLVEIEYLKTQIQESTCYSMAWFKALLRLEYILAYERQEKDKSFLIHFEKIEKEEGATKTLLLKRPSRPFPHNIEDAGDMTLKLQMEQERRNLAVEVVSIKDAGLRAKLKTPEDILDIDFSKIRGASLEIRNTIFVLEELTKAFDALPYPDEYGIQVNLTSDIRFIFGPPGTGKTTHIVNEEIFPAMLSDEELKVLVLTPTNKAADVLVTKGLQLTENPPDWLIRFGTTSEISIENAGLLKDSTYDISQQERLCVVTTVTRFPYDGFNNGAWDYQFKHIKWDIIIVDEASMIPISYIAYILQQQTQAQFIIGGDPFQIEPVVFAEDWQGENIYSMVRLDSFDPVLQKERMYPHPYKIQNLTTQYRSISNLGTLTSHFSYDGILRHNRFKEHQKKIILPNLPLKDINIIQFPVHKLESLYRPQLLQKSPYQLYSALLAVELVQYMSQELYKNQANEHVKIGIICPYKAQAVLVDKVLASLYIDLKNIKIQTGTIHSFQGDECHIIICLFNPPPNISRSPNAFLNKQNILNVAISRAKDYLILLMPNDETANIDNLYQLQRLRGILKYYLSGVSQYYKASDIEEIILGQPDYIYENSFVTTHQNVNVYTEPEKKYEIRIDDSVIDIQVNLGI